MSLATRCPSCHTVFRVVQDQLRVSEGWVRCGRCAEVFDASLNLVDPGTGEARRAPIELRSPPSDGGAEAGPTSSATSGPPLHPVPGADPGTLGGRLPSAAAQPAQTAQPAQPARSARSARSASEAAFEAAWEEAETVFAEDALSPVERTLVLPPPVPPERAAPGAAAATATGLASTPGSDVGADPGPSPPRAVPPDITLPLGELPATAWPARPAPPAPHASAAAPTAPGARAANASPAAADAIPDPAAGPIPEPIVESIPEPTSTPSFVRQADRAARWRRPGVRAALTAGIVLASATLALQMLVAFRDQAAARQPGLRPLIEALCEPLGCRVEPWRSLEALVVDSSAVLRVEKSDLYELNVTLRNRRSHDVAVPAIDLRLTDLQGQVISQRVLAADELGAPAPTVRGDGELQLQRTLRVTAAPVAGYTIELFYP